MYIFVIYIRNNSIFAIYINRFIYNCSFKYMFLQILFRYNLNLLKCRHIFFYYTFHLFELDFFSITSKNQSHRYHIIFSLYLLYLRPHSVIFHISDLFFSPDAMSSNICKPSCICELPINVNKSWTSFTNLSKRIKN